MDFRENSPEGSDSGAYSHNRGRYRAAHVHNSFYLWPAINCKYFVT